MKKILKKFIPNSAMPIIRKWLYSIKNINREETPACQVFQEIYDKNHWQSGESISGFGSEHEQTANLIPQLESFFKKYGIRSILDIPCGDFNWMKAVDKSGIQYIGGDIVEDLIIKNNKKYKNEKISFIHLDLIKDELPKVDAIFVRDCLVHLSYTNIKEAIDNIKKSGSKYLMTTTFVNHNVNYDIKTGDWRALNFNINPFNFIKPIDLINEGFFGLHEEFHDKSLGLWEINSLP